MVLNYFSNFKYKKHLLHSFFLICYLVKKTSASYNKLKLILLFLKKMKFVQYWYVSMRFGKSFYLSQIYILCTNIYIDKIDIH